MKAWQKAVAACVALIVLLGVGVVAYGKYATWRAEKEAQEVAYKEARKSVAEQVAAAEYFLRLTYDDTNITYAQLFDRADDRTKKVSDATIAVQASDLNDDGKEVTVAFLNQIGNVIQALESTYRKGLNTSSNVDSMKSAQSEYMASPYNEYTDRWERKRVQDAANEAKKALGELKDATKDFGDSLVSLQVFQKKNAVILKGYSIVNSAILGKALAKNRKQMEDF